MSLTTLLFDLDGTLLPLDLEPFMKGYFKALIPQIAHVTNPETIVDQIWKSTHHMMKNEDAALTNLEVFKSSFLGDTGLTESDIWPLFDSFYQETFGGLRELTRPTEISREICRLAYDKGYKLVLATNPIFPEVATRHRMKWAGIDDIPFHLVTTMEYMHFCKPNPKYFIEILEMVDESPFHCMMFGNDVQEDGVAGKLGMQTYLVNDYKIDRGLGHLEFTHEGTLQDVLAFIEALPTLQASVR